MLSMLENFHFSFCSFLYGLFFYHKQIFLIYIKRVKSVQEGKPKKKHGTIRTPSYVAFFKLKRNLCF